MLDNARSTGHPVSQERLNGMKKDEGVSVARALMCPVLPISMTTGDWERDILPCDAPADLSSQPPGLFRKAPARSERCGLPA